MSQVFKQDLTDDSVRPGGLFFVELLMPKQCDMPDRDTNGRGIHKAFRPC